jgi:hypothetical protein
MHGAMSLEQRRWYPWLLRVAWALLVVIAGPPLASALSDWSVPVRSTASVLLWAGWVVVLGALLVPHPLSLTVARVLSPGAVVVAVWAAIDGGGSLSSWLAAAYTVLPVAAVFLPETGVLFVNGSAYPNERRFPLRVPGSLLLGPVEVAWVLLVGLPVGAVLLLADGQWVVGALVAVAGAAVVVVLGRALHGLSRRWVVFVPAGLVLHDAMSLADPVLFPKAKISSIAVAAADTSALDLTQRSPGLAVELSLSEPAPLVLAGGGPRRAVGATVDASAVLFTPSRPGGVVDEARQRMGARGSGSAAS